MMRILEAQAPAKQNATATISTLSFRLTSAALIEDRRAAILGLRSFAKLYPASVASGGLKGLIAELHRSAEDPDTIKIVLETLLNLFEPDEKSPEASEDITLWLADEFTQNQLNLTSLLDHLQSNEFYPRLYVLSLLSHIAAARLQRTEEAILAVPLGISRVITMLDDKREAVQVQAVSLLVAITSASREIQKVVAFENAFDRVFNLIDGDGGLSHGSTTVQDCLSLLYNLLNMNSSNQSFFREVSGIPKVKKLLSAVVEEEWYGEQVPEHLRSQRDMNVWGLLSVIQLFLPQAAQGTMVNQQAFWQSGTLEAVLRTSFHTAFGTGVRTKALQICGDIIRANKGLQEQFGDLGVMIREPDSPSTKGTSTSPHKQKAPQKATFRTQNVIESLLELTLEPAPLALLDLRLAASSCVEAYVDGHHDIRTRVLRKAIDGHKAGGDASPNMLTVLLEPPEARSNSDPYQQWLAAVLVLHLLQNSPEAKKIASRIEEGDTENSEDIVTFAQIIAGNVFTGVRQEVNERALIGYLMVLSVLLFENPHAVNDLLQEAASVQGLSLALKSARETMPLVAGISAFVLGIIYEFSTKDSPISRTTLHDLLISSPGREALVDSLEKLRQNVFVRDFEFTPPQSGDGGLPNVFFDRDFIDFFKDNYSRFLRAIDKAPNIEVSVVINGEPTIGIPRDLIDNLNARIEQQRHESESAKVEHEQSLRMCEQRCQDRLEQAIRSHAAIKLGMDAKWRALNVKQGFEIQKLQRSIGELQDHVAEADRLRNENVAAMEGAEAQVKALAARLSKVEEQLGGELAAKKGIQTELDDLLVVFADLVSEDEDEDDEGAGGEDNEGAA